MNFAQYYHLDKIVNGVSIISSQSDKRIDIRPGQYNKGLISILEKSFAKEVQQILEKNVLFGNNLVPFLLTGFGDLFLVSKCCSSIYLFETQSNELSELDLDINYFFNAFLVDPDVVNDFLKAEYFDDICELLDCELAFEQVLILKPWRLLGGEDKKENYTKGNFLVYLDLLMHMYLET